MEQGKGGRVRSSCFISAQIFTHLEHSKPAETTWLLPLLPWGWLGRHPGSIQEKDPFEVQGCFLIPPETSCTEHVL